MSDLPFGTVGDAITAINNVVGDATTIDPLNVSDDAALRRRIAETIFISPRTADTLADLDDQEGATIVLGRAAVGDGGGDEFYFDQAGLDPGEDRNTSVDRFGYDWITDGGRLYRRNSHQVTPEKMGAFPGRTTDYATQLQRYFTLAASRGALVSHGPLEFSSGDGEYRADTTIYINGWYTPINFGGHIIAPRPSSYPTGVLPVVKVRKLDRDPSGADNDQQFVRPPLYIAVIGRLPKANGKAAWEDDTSGFAATDYFDGNDAQRDLYLDAVDIGLLIHSGYGQGIHIGSIAGVAIGAALLTKHDDENQGNIQGINLLIETIASNVKCAVLLGTVTDTSASDVWINSNRIRLNSMHGSSDWRSEGIPVLGILLTGRADSTNPTHISPPNMNYFDGGEQECFMALTRGAGSQPKSTTFCCHIGLGNRTNRFRMDSGAAQYNEAYAFLESTVGLCSGNEFDYTDFQGNWLARHNARANVVRRFGDFHIANPPTGPRLLASFRAEDLVPSGTVDHLVRDPWYVRDYYDYETAPIKMLRSSGGTANDFRAYYSGTAGRPYAAKIGTDLLTLGVDILSFDLWNRFTVDCTMVSTYMLLYLAAFDSAGAWIDPSTTTFARIMNGGSGDLEVFEPGSLHFLKWGAAEGPISFGIVEGSGVARLEIHLSGGYPLKEVKVWSEGMDCRLFNPFNGAYKGTDIAAVPKAGYWRLGHLISKPDGSGTARCSTAGWAFNGAWAADTVIAVGEWRKSTGNLIYQCTAVSGDAKTHPSVEPNSTTNPVTDDMVTWEYITTSAAAAAFT